MDAANLEFKELLERSGWKSQSEAARQLDLPPPSISRYLSGKDQPSKQTLRLFRLLLADKPSAASIIREDDTHGDIDVWRKKAQRAEKKLESLQAGLRKLLAASSDASEVHPTAVELGNAVIDKHHNAHKPSGV